MTDFGRIGTRRPWWHWGHGAVVFNWMYFWAEYSFLEDLTACLLLIWVGDNLVVASRHRGGRCWRLHSGSKWHKSAKKIFLKMGNLWNNQFKSTKRITLTSTRIICNHQEKICKKEIIVRYFLMQYFDKFLEWSLFQRSLKARLIL